MRFGTLFKGEGEEEGGGKTEKLRSCDVGPLTLMGFLP